MVTTRITHRLMADHSVAAVQSGLVRLAQVQEQLTTGKVLNRPSDSPTDTAVLLQHRAELRELTQHSRNAVDGIGWLDQAETVVQDAILNVREARELTLQASNSGALGQQGREAIAVKIDQIRAHLLVQANEDRLGRPLFGGATGGGAAYDATGAYVGSDRAVTRTVTGGEAIRVDVSGPDTFGDGDDSIFAALAQLSTNLRTPGASLTGDLDGLDATLDRMQNVVADIGGRSNRLQSVVDAAASRTISLTSTISSLEDIDVAATAVELGMREVAYKAALGATARVVQPSLLDFLR